ncbi:hypothetical protein EDC04DRAFT_2892450 [Pisolithus marmoratus]|nr:hypothetical protein EDC04DRAFT_2892447 [Pisolithus marmoratus]KAI6041945.1 hypothetical protein EDC04DRAFT_2892450 [Pisolithus marmoratus]
MATGLVYSHEHSAMHAELQTQLPVSPQCWSSRPDPAETSLMKPNQSQDVCLPAYTHTPAIAAKCVSPTTLSCDPPTPSMTLPEKSPESMAIGDSSAVVHPPRCQSSQPINRVLPPTPLAGGMGHTQLPEREGGLAGVRAPLVVDTVFNPAATPLSTPIHPAQQPHTPVPAMSSPLCKPESSLLPSDETQTRSDHTAAANPITPQLLPNHPDLRMPILTTTSAIAMCYTRRRSWPLKCMQKAIRKQKEYVTFYRSFSAGPLDLPPDVPEAYEHPWRIADLYVHHNQTEGTFQIWIRSKMRWIKVAVDTHHPTLSDYRLKLLNNGEPSWVLRKTMVTDRARVKRKQEALTTTKLADI